MFTAIYLPLRAKGKEDPSRSGFATEEEAEEYVFSQMCATCQEERRRALAGEEATDEDDWDPNLFPACFSEWITGPTEKVETAQNMDELMDACGWKTIYHRPETENEG